MEATEKKEFKNDNIIFKKSLSVTGIINLLAGAAVFYGISFIDKESTSLKMGVMILGAIFVIVGLVQLLMGKKQIICKESGVQMRQHDLYFDTKEMNKLRQSLENKQFEVLPNLKPAEGNKAGIKLDLFVSKDLKYVSAQVMQFIPFDYEPVAEPMHFYNEDAEALAKAVPAQK